MNKIANSLFGAPNCRPFGEIGGLPIGPKWTNLKIFQSYIVQNPNWKGDSFMKKMPTLVFWAPYCGPFWTYWGVCQSGHNRPIWKILNNFLHKIQIQRGSVLCKKSPTHVFEALFRGPFSKMGGLPTGPEWADLKNFNFTHTKSELKGGLFYEKCANSCINGPTVRAVLDKWGCRPIGPNWTNFDVWEHFPVQNQNSKGVSFMKKIAISFS